MHIKTLIVGFILGLLAPFAAASAALAIIAESTRAQNLITKGINRAVDKLLSDL